MYNENVLNFSDEDLSAEQWENEVKDWDLNFDDALTFRVNHPEISRRKILEENFDNKNMENDYFHSSCNEGIEFDDNEGNELEESKIDSDDNDENQQNQLSITANDENEREFQDIKINMTSPVFQEKYFEEDFERKAWIMVGDFSQQSDDDDVKEEMSRGEQNSEIDIIKDQQPSLTGRKSQKEVTFSDEIQIEILDSYDSSQTDESEDRQNETKINSTKSSNFLSDTTNDHFPSVKDVRNIFDSAENRKNKDAILLEKLSEKLYLPTIVVEENYRDSDLQTKNRRKVIFNLTSWCLYIY